VLLVIGLFGLQSEILEWQYERSKARWWLGFDLVMLGPPMALVYLLVALLGAGLVVDALFGLEALLRWGAGW
jgi:hypothetical protein